jgi:chemotaxis protein MotB
VYVSLAEKLLFPSGSTEVNPKGKQALQKVADVLKKNPDIGITIEGHTDNVPISTSCMKDNWDLSVLRATSITRIITDAGVDPKQIIASGRGEYFPVASNSTSDGKAKNRRSEIILTPNLAELAKLLGE